MTIKAFIFDLDGTLLNTISDLSDSINLALDRFGYPHFTDKEVMLKVGNGMKLLIQRCIPEEKQTEEHVLEVLRIFLDEYKIHQMDKTAPYPGIVELLKELNQKDIKCGVISNKQNPNTQSIIKHFFSDIDFTFVSGEVAGISPKPNPTLTLRCIQAMKLDPDDILYVGDTKVDIATGHNAGLKTVGVTWGFRDRKELVDNHADYLIDHPSELLKLL
ncbi:MAG: HAD family hydrolase [Erysipelotrichaceae bacterium]